METFWNSEAISTVLDLVALTSLKAAAVNGGTGTMLFGAGIGGLAYYNMGRAIALDGQADSNAVWNVLSTIFSTLVGIFYWKEHLDSSKLLGIALGVVSLYLLN